MKNLMIIVVTIFAASNATAALIPYYQMSSLAFLSTEIVLCEEGDSVKKKIKNQNGYEYECDATTMTVIKSFKGTCQAKDKLSVHIDTIYRREIAFSKFPGPTKQVEISKGKALLFLTKTNDGWHPVLGGVKLLINGETHCYGQFMGNPGALYLARMKPENIKVDDDKPYDEELLLKDLTLAIEKSKTMTKVEHEMRFGGIRPEAK